MFAIIALIITVALIWFLMAAPLGRRTVSAHVEIAVPLTIAFVAVSAIHATVLLWSVETLLS